MDGSRRSDALRPDACGRVRFGGPLAVCAVALLLTLAAAPVRGAQVRELIIAFGDSITEGYCRTPCNGYPDVLDEMLVAEGRPTKVLNCGVGGEVTTVGVGRIEAYLAADYSRPNHCYSLEEYNGTVAKYVLIMEGANDAIHGYSPYTTRDNLHAMLDKARDAGVTPILATITPNTNPSYDFGSCNSGVLGGYNALIRQLAEDEDVILADQCNATDAIWSSLTCEGLHPTLSGDEVLSETFAAVLPAFVPELPSIGAITVLLLQ